MKYYIDIQLIADAEVSLGFIWQKVYAQMHLALVASKDNNDKVDIAFSFPLYQKDKFPLGNILRVFSSSSEKLEALEISKYLNRLEEYISISVIKSVPDAINGYASFSRKNFKSNADIRRLVKRFATRNNITEEEALTNYRNTEDKYLKLKEDNKLPFINIKSLSTNKYLKIFIFKEDKKSEEKGLFNTFGLSKTATIPIF